MSPEARAAHVKKRQHATMSQSGSQPGLPNDVLPAPDDISELSNPANAASMPKSVTKAEDWLQPSARAAEVYHLKKHSKTSNAWKLCHLVPRGLRAAVAPQVAPPGGADLPVLPPRLSGRSLQ